ncbi:YqeG family HAD IIIA-type phosphatase [Oscillospiraceae bacterium OttesenSCG-928-F05]|nr:YqeG family HAD IIIA-type phosphatase [Oscillospiraceae bacterium OttesenSCG-928-F05]
MAFSLIADAVFASVLDITPNFLRARRIRGLCLDMDNTLARYGEAAFASEIAQWLSAMKEAGILLYVVSNNKSTARLAALCAPLGIGFTHLSRKPSRRGFVIAAEAMGLSPHEAAAVGDQVFTDVLGGKRAGMQALLVTPRGLRDNPWFWIRHGLETPFIALARRKMS